MFHARLGPGLHDCLLRDLKQDHADTSFVQNATYFLDNNLDQLFRDNISKADWESLLLSHDFIALDRVLNDDVTLGRESNSSCSRFLPQAGKAILIHLTGAEWRLILLQLDTGSAFHDPSSALQTRRLTYLIELKGELMRRIVKTLRPAGNEQSLCAVLTALVEISSAIGLENAIDNARDDLVRLQGALSSLRASSAEDRAVAKQVETCMLDSGTSESRADIELRVRLQRADARAIGMSKTMQK